MRVMKDKDLQTFERLCGLSQSAMQKTMAHFLRSKYKNVIDTNDYIIAEGDIPVALVAHMDTVFPRPTETVYYDRVKNVLWGSNGLGADDRAGIFALIQIVRRGLRPYIILTTDEEKGAIGACSLAMTEKAPEGLRYIIQLDRRGADDCVFYDCDNKEFVDYVESFGFTTAIGSFSDISVICPEWKVAGVNLSIGYEDEHSFSEVLHVGQMMNTIDKVVRMLTVDFNDVPVFPYVPHRYAATSWYRRIGTSHAKVDKTVCHKCGKKHDTEDLIPAKTTDFKWHYYCADCLTGKVDFCLCCGEAFEIPSEGEKMSLCEDCFYDMYYSNN